MLASKHHNTLRRDICIKRSHHPRSLEKILSRIDSLSSSQRRYPNNPKPIFNQSKMVSLIRTTILLLATALTAQACSYCQCRFADGSNCCVYSVRPFLPSPNFIC